MPDRFHVAVGDPTAGTKLSVFDFLSIVYKWSSALAVDFVPGGPFNIIGHSPKATVNPVRLIVPVVMPANVVGGITPFQIRDFRRKFGLDSLPDKDFFAPYRELTN